MARNAWEPAVAGRDTPMVHPDGSDASLGDLLKRLSHDTGELLQQELALAKVEAAQVAQNVRKAATEFAVAAAFALTGLLSLGAFAVIALGNALDGRYALSAAIVGVVALVVGGILAKRASANLAADRLRPRQLESMRRDATWAGREAAALKRDLTGATTRNHNRGDRYAS